MQAEAYRQSYRKRSEVAEFPMRGSKRGLAKVAMGSLWAVIAYNEHQ
jgi:hypothetical protein